MELLTPTLLQVGRKAIFSLSATCFVLVFIWRIKERLLVPGDDGEGERSIRLMEGNWPVSQDGGIQSMQIGVKNNP